MNSEQTWDSAYDQMTRAFYTQEPLVVGAAMLPFAAVLDHVMLCDEPQVAFRALLKQEGEHSIAIMRDMYRHKCAKAYANWTTNTVEVYT